MLELLIWIIGFCLALYIMVTFARYVPVPEPIKQIVIAVVGCVGLIVFLKKAWPLLVG